MSDTVRKSLWRRLLDGGRPWGSLEVWPTRYGVTRYRLTVFPPGTRPDDRVLLRAWRGWPAWGLTTFLVFEILLGPTIAPGTALGVSAGIALGAGALLAAMTGGTRGNVRTLSAVRQAGIRDTSDAETFAEFCSLARGLADADRMLAAGDIGPAEHELLVWRVYDRMSVAARTGV